MLMRSGQWVETAEGKTGYLLYRPQVAGEFDGQTTEWLLFPTGHERWTVEEMWDVLHGQTFWRSASPTRRWVSRERGWSVDNLDPDQIIRLEATEMAIALASMLPAAQTPKATKTRRGRKHKMKLPEGEYRDIEVG